MVSTYSFFSLFFTNLIREGANFINVFYQYRDVYLWKDQALFE